MLISNKRVKLKNQKFEFDKKGFSIFKVRDVSSSFFLYFYATIFLDELLPFHFVTHRRGSTLKKSFLSTLQKG